MGGGFESKPGGRSLVEQELVGGMTGSGSGSVPSVGKRTLTEGLSLPIMRKATGDAGTGTAVEAQVGAAGKTNGTPLPAPLRGELEPALGADLSAVRIHTGAASASASDALSAKAYATGQDVHFAANAYDPASASGRHLIAHEVAHTVQQQGAAPGIQRSATVSTPGDAAERQAESFASAFVGGASTQGIVTQGMQPAAQIHRFGRDEHADIPTKHLTNLYEYLRTPAGKKWATDHGYKNPEDLIRRMEADPVVKTYNEKPTAAEQAKGTEHHVAKLHGAKTEFSYGEVTAMMGDLFGHWESLYNADEEQRAHLMGEDTTASNEKYTKGEYLKLAAKNDSHFAGKNQDAWLDHHNQAIQLAMKSGSDEMLFEQALFIDAAGAHFLTDAFSAGHQFEKAKIFNAVLIDVNKHFIETDNKQMQAYVGLAGAADPGNIANLVIKAIHDKMNLEGFDVANGKGMKWKTFGDGNLEKSPETQRIAALAVFESRQQVIGARNAKTPPEVKEVQDFFPTNNTIDRANDYALGLIPWARQQVEKILYDQRGAASSKAGAVGGFIVEHNLEAIGDPARERNILQDQQFDRDHGGSGAGTVAPQFEFRFGK